MEIPIYQLLYDGDRSPEAPALPQRNTANGDRWGSTGKDARTLAMFVRALSRTNERDRRILLSMAEKMARRANG
jgi:hypothetical protein